MRAEISFGQWLPDQSDFNNPGLIECKNVYPASNGYAPFLAANGTGLSVTGTVLGAKGFERTDGTRVIVCGTTTDLFVIAEGAVTASSLGLSVSTDDAWRFEQFGSAVYATALSGDTYSLTDLDTDTTFSAASGTPPKGDAMARVGDFLMMGNLVDVDASTAPYRIRWSQFNNPGGDWSSSITYQSGAVDMPSRYGPVTGLSGGAVGLIMQRTGVSRIRYVGGRTAFAKEVIDEERGCVSPASVVRVGSVAYWVAHDGFCRSDGSVVEVISPGRVWDWFLENINQEYLARVQGAIDWPNRCVVWAFYGADDTAYTGQIIYNWEQDRWSRAAVSVDWLVEGSQEGMSLEDVSALYPDLDAMTVSLDSPAFSSRGRVLSCFVSGEFCDFNGSALEAEFETGDLQIATSRRATVREVWPLVENVDANTKIAIGTRATPGGTVTYTSDASEGSMGFVPVIADGRFARARMKIPAAANWDKAQGVQLDMVGGGYG